MQLSIYILTHTQRGYIRKTVETLLKSVSADTKLIVSTNTDEDDYRTYLSQLCKKHHVKLITHANCDAKTHSHQAYTHCSTDLCMLLHDDDEIYGAAFAIYINTVFQNPGFASYSCNDKIIIEDRIKSNKIDDGVKFVPSKFEITLSYLLNRHFICYPTIIYDKTRLSIKFLDTKFGKYNDAKIILDLVQKRHLFIGAAAIGYRIHGGQDSAEKSRSRYYLKMFLFLHLMFSFRQFSLFRLKIVYSKLKYKSFD